MKYTIIIFCLLLSFLSNAQNNTSKPKMVKAYFLNQKIKATLLCKAEQLSSDKSDVDAVMRINESLMGVAVEKEPKLLEVNLLLSKAPVQKDFLVFAIESETPKELILQIFSDEGFLMPVHCFFNVPKGGFFYAIDVEYMDAGHYRFRLKDDNGAELNRRIKITRK